MTQADDLNHVPCAQSTLGYFVLTVIPRPIMMKNETLWDIRNFSDFGPRSDTRNLEPPETGSHGELSKILAT